MQTQALPCIEMQHASAAEASCIVPSHLAIAHATTKQHGSFSIHIEQLQHHRCYQGRNPWYMHLTLFILNALSIVGEPGSCTELFAQRLQHQYTMSDGCIAVGDAAVFTAGAQDSCTELLAHCLKHQWNVPDLSVIDAYFVAGVQDYAAGS